MKPAVAAAALLALVFVLGLLALWGRWRAPAGRRLRRPAPRLAHPVVLAHGLMGFDEIALAGVRREYFRGVSPKLTALGAKVHLPRLSPFASIAPRARCTRCSRRRSCCSRSTATVTGWCPLHRSAGAR